MLLAYNAAIKSINCQDYFPNEIVNAKYQ